QRQIPFITLERLTGSPPSQVNADAVDAQTLALSQPCVAVEQLTQSVSRTLPRHGTSGLPASTHQPPQVESGESVAQSESFVHDVFVPVNRPAPKEGQPMVG